MGEVTGWRRFKGEEKRGHMGKEGDGVQCGWVEGEGKEGEWVLQSKTPGKES